MNTNDKIKQLEEKCEELNGTVAELLNEISKLKEENKKDMYEFAPEEDEIYLFLNGIGEVGELSSTATGWHEYRLAFYNAFPETDRTKVLLEDYAKQIKLNNRLMQLKIMLCPDYEPNWNDADECKYYIAYSYEKDKFVHDYSGGWNHFGVIFPLEAAKKACEILNETWEWED